jgi:HD-GYP domain-containing protein (c-di-GMP phosphodiesterase class II)
MAAQQVQVEVRELKAGMFVSKLDCPWHKTPFPVQGFYIQGEEDLLRIQRHCRHVFVDVEKAKVKFSYAAHAVLNLNPVAAAEKDMKVIQVKHHGEENLKLAPIVIKSPVSYSMSSGILKEVGKVEKLHKQVYEAIDRVYTLVQCGADIDIKETRVVADGMVESVIRNPDALVWLAKMNEVSSHAYQHSVKSAIWALVFGRHLGLDRHSLSLLAMGALLCQVGKSKLTPELLAVDPTHMDAEQHAEYEKYVEYSLEILGKAEHTPKGVLAITEFHRERHNGSGFPKHVTGDQIPLLAKIVGLVDHYQDTIAPIDLDKGLSPLDAVTQLYEQRNVMFQQDMVERFIQAVGVYPTGTLVELSTQEVAIVTGHNMDRRLQPKIMIVTDANKQPLKHGKVVDLKEWNTRQAGREPLFIKSSLPKGAYDIDENAWLVSGATSKWSFRHLTAALAG